LKVGFNKQFKSMAETQYKIEKKFVQQDSAVDTQGSKLTMTVEENNCLNHKVPIMHQISDVSTTSAPSEKFTKKGQANNDNVYSRTSSKNILQKAISSPSVLTNILEEPELKNFEKGKKELLMSSSATDITVDQKCVSIDRGAASNKKQQKGIKYNLQAVTEKFKQLFRSDKAKMVEEFKSNIIKSSNVQNNVETVNSSKKSPSFNKKEEEEKILKEREIIKILRGKYPLPIEFVKNYEVLEPLGDGAFGFVFAAFSKVLGKEVFLFF
jgi:hypothetical protein